jgi:hypothetical protein
MSKRKSREKSKKISKDIKVEDIKNEEEVTDQLDETLSTSKNSKDEAVSKARENLNDDDETKNDQKKEEKKEGGREKVEVLGTNETVLKTRDEELSDAIKKFTSGFESIMSKIGVSNESISNKRNDLGRNIVPSNDKQVNTLFLKAQKNVEETFKELLALTTVKHGKNGGYSQLQFQNKRQVVSEIVPIVIYKFQDQSSGGISTIEAVDIFKDTRESMKGITDLITYELNEDYFTPVGITFKNGIPVYPSVYSQLVTSGRSTSLESVNILEYKSALIAMVFKMMFDKQVLQGVETLQAGATNLGNQTVRDMVKDSFVKKVGPSPALYAAGGGIAWYTRDMQDRVARYKLGKSRTYTRNRGLEASAYAVNVDKWRAGMYNESAISISRNLRNTNSILDLLNNYSMYETYSIVQDTFMDTEILSRDQSLRSIILGLTLFDEVKDLFFDVAEYTFMTASLIDVKQTPYEFMWTGQESRSMQQIRDLIAANSRELSTSNVHGRFGYEMSHQTEWLLFNPPSPTGLANIILTLTAYITNILLFPASSKSLIGNLTKYMVNTVLPMISGDERRDYMANFGYVATPNGGGFIYHINRQEYGFEDWYKGDVPALATLALRQDHRVPIMTNLSHLIAPISIGVMDNDPSGLLPRLRPGVERRIYGARVDDDGNSELANRIYEYQNLMIRIISRSTMNSPDLGYVCRELVGQYTTWFRLFACGLSDTYMDLQIDMGNQMLSFGSEFRGQYYIGFEDRIQVQPNEGNVSGSLRLHKEVNAGIMGFDFYDAWNMVLSAEWKVNLSKGLGNNGITQKITLPEMPSMERLTQDINLISKINKTLKCLGIVDEMQKHDRHQFWNEMDMPPPTLGINRKIFEMAKVIVGADILESLFISRDGGSLLGVDARMIDMRIKLQTTDGRLIPHPNHDLNGRIDYFTEEERRKMEIAMTLISDGRVIKTSVGIRIKREYIIDYDPEYLPDVDEFERVEYTPQLFTIVLVGGKTQLSLNYGGNNYLNPGDYPQLRIIIRTTVAVFDDHLSMMRKGVAEGRLVIDMPDLRFSFIFENEDIFQETNWEELMNANTMELVSIKIPMRTFRSGLGGNPFVQPVEGRRRYVFPLASTRGFISNRNVSNLVERNPDSLISPLRELDTGTTNDNWELQWSDNGVNINKFDSDQVCMSNEVIILGKDVKIDSDVFVTSTSVVRSIR